MQISEKIVNETRDWVNDLIEKSSDPKFEKRHQADVEFHCMALSKLRHLDPNISIIIGLLHDVSRIRYDVMGKTHSAISADIAMTYLEKYNIDDDTLLKIETAIKSHNKKKVIGSKYEELIKDADSLAHEKEGFDFSFKPYEYRRVQLASLNRIDFEMQTSEVILKVFCRKLDDLLLNLTKQGITLLDSKAIHDLRVLIRTLRAIIVCLKQAVEDDDALKKVDSVLKQVFHLLEDIRINYVFMKELKELGHFKKACKILKKREKVLHGLMLHSLKKFLKSKEMAVLKQFSIEDLVFVRVPQANVDKYLKVLTKATLKKIDTVHALRIQGKKMKYFIENDLVYVNHSLYKETLDALHHTIGRLHDIDENEKLLSIKAFVDKLKIEPSEVTYILERYEKEKKHLYKEIQVEIFTMKKMFATYEVGLE